MLPNTAAPTLLVPSSRFLLPEKIALGHAPAGGRVTGRKRAVTSPLSGGGAADEGSEKEPGGRGRGGPAPAPAGLAGR